jgi:hypothetical protein
MMLGSDISSLASLLDQCPSENLLVREPPKTKVTLKTQADVEAEKRKKAESIFEDIDFIVPKQPTEKSKNEPEYEILYQQKINAEDVFFNLRDIDNSCDHCEQLTVKIKMPGAFFKDITLDVFPDRLVVQSGDYYLSLALPQPVKKDEGNAKWDKGSSTLTVILPINRVVKYITDPANAFVN